MRATSVLRDAAAGRTPLIKFIGKRTIPSKCRPQDGPQCIETSEFLDSYNIVLASVDRTPRVHPASPAKELPDNFVTYRAKAQQHGPLNSPNRPSLAYGAIGGQTGSSLGPVNPRKGEHFDRNELPLRFRRMPWSQTEMEAVDTGGASLFT